MTFSIKRYRNAYAAVKAFETWTGYERSTSDLPSDFEEAFRAADVACLGLDIRQIEVAAQTAVMKRVSTGFPALDILFATLDADAGSYLYPDF